MAEGLVARESVAVEEDLNEVMDGARMTERGVETSVLVGFTFGGLDKICEIKVTHTIGVFRTHPS